MVLASAVVATRASGKRPGRPGLPERPKASVSSGASGIETQVPSRSTIRWPRQRSSPPARTCASRERAWKSRSQKARGRRLRALAREPDPGDSPAAAGHRLTMKSQSTCQAAAKLAWGQRPERTMCNAVTLGVRVRFRYTSPASRQALSIRASVRNSRTVLRAPVSSCARISSSDISPAPIRVIEDMRDLLCQWVS